MIIEYWKDIPGYEGLYQASTEGRIKSLNYMHTGKEKIRKYGITKDGYNIIDLWKNGVSKTFSVHRIIWVTFNGPIPEGMQCNHNNERKTDNRLENLNLLTSSENNLWGTKIKRMLDNRTGIKKRKIVHQFDMNNNLIKEWESASEAARQLGYSQGNISSCCRGKLAYAYGYKWEYK